jgi:hypothetical protein
MNKWLVGTDDGMLLISELEFTTDISKATPFDKIGDAMRECIRLNNVKLDLTSKFKVIPL